MTIKQQLFILISSLILVLTAAQLSLLYFFKNQVESEISNRGEQVADQILKFTVEQIGDDESITGNNSVETKVLVSNPQQQRKSHRSHLKISITNMQNTDSVFKVELPLHIARQPQQLKGALIDLPKELKPVIQSTVKNFISQEMNNYQFVKVPFKISIEKHRVLPKHLIKKHLRQQIELFRKEREKEGRVQVSTDKNEQLRQILVENKHHTLKRQFFKKHSVINSMFNYVIIIIIVTSLISLVAVYWLSNKISSPLHSLANGFKQLEQGKFGQQLSPFGVCEMQYVIEQFNHMSIQLKQLALTEAKLQKQAHLVEISDVSKGIAHALRNPLHTIGLALEQLQDTNLKVDKRNGLVAKVQNKIKQLDKNIQALMTISDGDLRRDQRIDLNLIAQDVILELNQSHINKALNLDIQVTGQVPTIFADQNELRSVLHTLMCNSYDACLSNEEIIKIEVKLSQIGSELIIQVEDNGPGISADIESRLFDPHVSTKAEGAGMGLYISKRIIELYYNGNLTVTNRFSENQLQGAVATVSLPTDHETFNGNS